jgi:hopanoid biosynthesis associated protein HpnK
MKKVIINADDFGLSRGVNEGIILAHQKGILTSATLMANMPGYEQAVELALQNEKLGVGVHLNIVRGRPISPANRLETLVNGEGLFFSNAYLILKKLMLKKINLEEVERELRAQIEKVLRSGIQASHLDSEKHIHTIPPVFKIVLKLGKEYGIPRVRYIHEYCFSFRLPQILKSFWLSLSCSFMRKKIRESGIMRSDRFYGVCQSGQMTALRLKKILAHLDEGITEIMVHPGFLNQELGGLEKQIGSYYIHKCREKELEALLDGELKKIIESEKIDLINFSEL